MTTGWARAAGAWVDGAHRHARKIVLVSLLLTIASVLFIAESFDISTDTTDMLSPELPFRQRMIEMNRLFPASGNELLIVVEGVTADLAADGAERLAAALDERPDLFRHVFAPASDPFFRRNGLLYLDLEELQALADRLALAQPFLGTLSRDPTLGGLFGLLAQAAEEAAKGSAARLPVAIDFALEAVAGVAEAQAEGRYEPLSWSGLMNGGESRLAGKRQMVVVRPVLDYGSLAPAGAAMRAVRDTARALSLTPDTGVRVSMTGTVALDHEELGSVEEGMGWAGLVSLTLVLGLLILCFRSGRLVAAVLLTLVMGLIWTGAFAFLAVGQLNLISVAFAVLFIGLSVDFGIHFGLRYQEERAGSADTGGALRRAGEATGGPLALCAAAAAVAFYAFLPTDYVGLAQLGLIAGTGMFVAFAANLTLLPALIALMPPRTGAVRRSLGAGIDFRRQASRLLAGAAVVAVAAVPVAWQVDFDFDPLHLKDPDTESLSTLNRLIAEGEVQPYKLSLLADDSARAKTLRSQLAGLPEVGEVRVLDDYLAKDQQAKLAVVENLSFSIGPSLGSPEAARPPSGEAAAVARERLQAGLSRLGTPAAGRLHAALARLGGGPEALGTLERCLLRSLPGRLEQLSRSLEAAPFALNDLPQAVLSRAVATDGRQKVDVSPASARLDREALQAFVAAVRTVDPEATGTPVTIIEAGDAVIGAFKQAGAITFAGVALLLIAALRRGWDLVYVFLPLFLAGELTVAASALLGMPFNFANVIVLPLLVGLGVASGIHLVTRAREEQAGAMMATSTPRAVTFSALTTVGSFGSIALSSHPGTASMGVLLTVALALTLLSAMTIVPSLIALTSGARE